MLTVYRKRIIIELSNDKGMNIMNIAILYQVKEPPQVGNIRKPMKEGGYSDSGSDLAYELKKNGYNLITPVENPIEKYIGKVKVIGQKCSDVQTYDDKYYTNHILLEHGLDVVNDVSVKSADEYNGDFPCVIKPIRGRGSQGVSVIENKEQLDKVINKLVADKIYGSEFMIEPYLDGDEITVAVFPADSEHKKPYCLPPVSRFNYQNGIAPYSGKVAVSENSKAVENIEEYTDIIHNCEKAYEILGLKAPIRIDCRKNKDGKYLMFDVNMKPNMTMATRVHRQNQDSLMMLAAEKAGYSRIGLIELFLNTAWK